MVARDVFKRMLNVFDPKRPLHGAELEEYYIERPHAPLEPMKAYLLAAERHVTVLFGGHRGSGKSTELARLAKDLEHEFFVVPVSARSLNQADLNYVDVILACAAMLFRKVTEASPAVRIPRPLLQDVLAWLSSEITRETTISTTKSGSLGGKITALVLSLQGKYATETSTREMVRDRLDRRLSELIDRINAICQEVERVGPPPLIVVEDLDKTDLERARDLFFDHASTLNSLACRIIYTFPIALRYANAYIERKGDYSRPFLLPNVSLYTRSGQRDEQGRKALRSVITRRVEAGVFGHAALEEIVELSGGLMRDLIRIVADAALEALTRNSDKISMSIVHTVAAGLANDYRGVLLPEHYDALKELRETKQIVPTDAVQQLLENLSLLEYRNDDVWCDTHPALDALLDSTESVT